MRKLKAKEKKGSGLAEVEITYIVKVGSFNTLSPYLLPLTDPFTFNFSFSILPDVISNNIPISFL